MLHYRSRLLRTLHTVAFAGVFLAGFAEEKQTLEIELYSRYREDPVSPDWFFIFLGGCRGGACVPR